MDDETKLLAMMALAGTNERSAELWTDHRIVGVPMNVLARQHGVSPNRISQLVRKADQRILRYVATRRTL